MSEQPIRVQVELRADRTAAGMIALAQWWQREYPDATIRTITGYGEFVLVLELPQGSTVTQPRLIDARGVVTEADNGL